MYQAHPTCAPTCEWDVGYYEENRTLMGYHVKPHGKIHASSNITKKAHLKLEKFKNRVE